MNDLSQEVSRDDGFGVRLSVSRQRNDSLQHQHGQVSADGGEMEIATCRQIRASVALVGRLPFGAQTHASSPLQSFEETAV